ncbi:MAG TPA: hypothetical protein VL333_01545 [Candidatus Saccharimonadales bacterium]|jgi:hypothetical protein|nr:hypothetical protein [Candidatus Saccharimonadales bacterium]
MVRLALQRAADATRVEDLAIELAKLFDLLENSVVVRPDGEAFQVVRVNGALRYLPVDLDALVRDGAHDRVRRPALPLALLS